MKNLFPLIFFIFLVNSTFSQSAIGQLEEITGQKINRYSSSGTGYYNPSPPPGPEFYNGQYKDFIIKLCNDENQKAIKFFSKKNYRKALHHFINAEKYFSGNDKSSILQNIELTKQEIEREKAQKLAEREKKESSKPAKPNTKSDLEKEKDMMKNQTQTWVEYQKASFKKRIEQPNYWCQNFVNQFDLGVTDPPKKTMKDLQPGDVILLAPLKGDKLGELVRDFDQWASENANSNLSHTVTYLKTVNGIKYFLDCQLGAGPTIMTEDEFRRLYFGRDTKVARLSGLAQPINDADAQKFWKKAMELHSKNLRPKGENAFVKWFNFTNYGTFGEDNMVCSEASWTILNLKKELPLSKSWKTRNTVKFGPADFYNEKQHFFISGFSMYGD